MTHTRSISLLIAVLTVALFSVSSCDKENDDDTHGSTATITINSPAAAALYNTSDTVKIKGTITAEENLHGCDIFIRDKANNSSVFVGDIHTHATSITIDTFWVNTLSGDTTSLELEIIATVDHDGNTVGKKVSFTALP